MVALAMPGCVATVAGSVARPAADAAGREVARRAVARAVAERFPGAPVAEIGECVVGNASPGEIGTIAVDAGGAAAARAARREVAPVGETTARVVGEILARPDTRACLRERLSPAVLRSLRPA